METTKTEKVNVLQLEASELTFCLMGASPYMQNSFSLQALQDLLYPPEASNQLERKINLKHNPLEEFRSSIHESIDRNSPTHAVIPNRAFIKSISQAAADMPGSAYKTTTKRWISIKESEVALFGIPELYMTNCRLAGRNAVPDVRTRAVFRNWACTVTLWHDPKLITKGTVVTLFAGAGVIIGIGADRPELGGGFGKFVLVDHNNPEFLAIIQHGGRSAQEEALQNPGFFNRLSEQLYQWFNEELIRREQQSRKVA